MTQPKIKPTPFFAAHARCPSRSSIAISVRRSTLTRMRIIINYCTVSQLNRTPGHPHSLLPPSHKRPCERDLPKIASRRVAEELCHHPKRSLFCLQMGEICAHPPLDPSGLLMGVCFGMILRDGQIQVETFPTPWRGTYCVRTPLKNIGVVTCHLEPWPHRGCRTRSPREVHRCKDMTLDRHRSGEFGEMGMVREQGDYMLRLCTF